MRHIEINKEWNDRQPFNGETPKKSILDSLQDHLRGFNIAHGKMKSALCDFIRSKPLGS